MIENIGEIETALGLPAGDFKKLYEDAEAKKIDLTPFEIVKKTDLETRINNIKSETSTSALEIAIKNARTKYALDFTGKNIDNFAEALTKKAIADAKIEPNTKVAELQTDLDKMRANAAEWEKKHGDLASATAAEKKQFQIESMVVAELPKVKTKIPIQDLKALFELKYKPAYNDAGVIVFHNDKGEVIKNTATLNTASLKEVMAEFQTPYIEAATGGSGGDDAPGQGKEGTFEAFQKEMEAAGTKTGRKILRLILLTRKHNSK